MLANASGENFLLHHILPVIYLPIFDPIVKMSEKASILKLNLPSPSTVGSRMKLQTKKPRSAFYLFRPGVRNSRTDTDYDARRQAAVGHASEVSVCGKQA